MASAKEKDQDNLNVGNVIRWKEEYATTFIVGFHYVILSIVKGEKSDKISLRMIKKPLNSAWNTLAYLQPLDYPHGVLELVKGDYGQ
jgi:hypothetical protein